jgi:CheY-like chemotaxis protein
MLAHELRNPLAPIRNAAEILRLHYGDKQQAKPAIEMMHRQLRQMTRLIDDLLDVNRISRGTIALRKESIELSSIVQQAAEAVRHECESMGHELTVTLPPRPVYVHADPTRLAQIVGNLLNNACKFTEKGGRVLLSVKRDDEQAVIQVQDTGIGIAPEQLPMVFDMFMQVDTSLKRARDGLGLGLTLVRNLAELQAGTVEARSAGLGRGSTFVVRLPVVSKPLEPRPQRVQQVATIPVKRRVLVVDDNRDAAESLAMLLKLSGHEVYTAHDGLEAVDSAAKIQPDVVLLDIGLPKLDGYEAARRIRQQQQDKRVMLVALTGWGQEEDRRRSEEASFDLHLVKPVDLATLTKVLAEPSAG